MNARWQTSNGDFGGNPRFYNIGIYFGGSGMVLGDHAKSQLINFFRMKDISTRLFCGLENKKKER